MEKLLGFSILRVLSDCCVVNLQKWRHQVSSSEVTKTIQKLMVSFRSGAVKCRFVLHIAHAWKRLVLVVGRLGDVLKNRVNSANRFEKQLLLF